MKYAVLDLETTGNQSQDRIIQIGLVIVDETQILERYTSLVNPGMSIPPYISGLTGITDEQVADAPKAEEALAECMPMLEGCVLVAHNVGFDVGFLQHALKLAWLPPFEGRMLDTMDLLRIAFPDLSSLQLSLAAYALDIPHERPHQADSDAEVTALLLQRSLARLNELPLLTIQRIAELFAPADNDLSWFFQELRLQREMHTALDPDTHHYYRQFAINVEDWGDEPDCRSREDRAKLERPFPDFYEDVKSALRERFDGYEARPAQERMVEAVEASLEEDTHLMIEAGTGTGKSLGYLIPSLYYGIREDRKIIVSTHTINLQEQLRKRDVPLLNDIFPVPFKAAVLKGRNHYLCLRKFENKVNMRDFINPREDLVTAAQMLVWLGLTTRGDDEELHHGSRGHEFWRTVESDTDSCLNRACPWFKKCFYHRARNEANAADVIITNHSMLFVDMKAENRLLPAYNHLVIDEAHHFEEVASRHLGQELFYTGFVGTLIWLYKDSRSGLLPLLKMKLQHVEAEEPEAGGWMQTLDGTMAKLVEVKLAWDEFCELLYTLMVKIDPNPTDNGQLVVRVKNDALPPNWDKLVVMEDNLFLGLSDVVKPLNELVTVLKEKQDELGLQNSVTDLSGALKNLADHRDVLRFFMQRKDENYVYWVEAGGYMKSKSLQLVAVPKDVGPLLNQYFFSQKDSIVMTSATLSVDKSFHYTGEQMGLDLDKDSDKVKSVLLPSSFNYRQQALVMIPRDFPSIKGAAGEQRFTQMLADSLGEVALAMNGRMLALFTSYRMLKQVYPELKERLGGAGIHVLGQGIDSNNRSKLTMMFQQNNASVLLGTSSFWEGVDIPGDALSCLAIVRLPFQPPTHPLVEAKCEELTKQKQNPFLKLSVPQAVIRFKQGFGRLVRSARDKGVVIVYDTRVIDTTYGKYFLYSLPGPKIEHMPTGQLVPRIKEWMKEEA